eukprot:Tbor_TRINITY_DN1991_c0_g1::TRINITY_DN1991_c0_g1_i1::g.3488::m.3488/K03456/PPP2R1; serine/threonine-protein phosphatase 2A regulatory subunit A
MSDHFSTVNTMIEALRSDDPEQRLESVRGIHLIASALGQERTREELIPFLTDYLDENDDVLREFAKGLATMLPRVGGMAHVKCITNPLVLLCGLEDVTVRDEAISSLKVIGESVFSPEEGPNSPQQQDFFQTVDSMAASESPLTRCSAAFLLAVPYKKVTLNVKAQLRQTFQKLCSDEEIMVRRGAVVALGESFAPALGSSCSDMLPVFSTLCRDGSDGIRMQCAKCAPVLMQYMVDTSRSQVVQLIKTLSTDSSWRVRYMVADILHNISTCFPQQELTKVAFAVFKSLCQDTEPEIRAAAVFNMNSMLGLLAEGRKGVEKDKKELLLAGSKLVSDLDPHVRMSLASSILKCQMYVEKSLWNSTIVSTCLKLLQDSEPDVRLALVSGFSSLGSSSEGREIAPKLISVIVDLSKDPKWRIRETVVRQLPSLIINLGKSAEDILDVCVAALDDRVATIREVACEACAQLVKEAGVTWTKTNFFPKITILAQKQPNTESKEYDETTPVPNNYLRRVTFIHLMLALLTVLDATTIGSSFSSILAELATDDVPNVRINCARMLALAKKAGKSNKEMDNALTRLSNDNDSDVVDATITH